MEYWREKMYANELYHHGILGQKWGVRRYQNKDGTLTLAGKKRQAKDLVKKRTISQDYLDVKQLRKKKAKYLSNEELSKVNERKRLEAEYANKGEQYLKKALVENGVKLAAKAVTVAAVYAGAKYISKKYNLDAETIGKNIIDFSGTLATSMAREAAKGTGEMAGSVAREAKKAAGEAVKEAITKHEETRRKVARSSGAKAYVRGIDNLVRTVRRR